MKLAPPGRRQREPTRSNRAGVVSLQGRVFNPSHRTDDGAERYLSITWRAILWSKRVAHGASITAPSNLYCLSRTDSVAVERTAGDSFIWSAPNQLRCRFDRRFSSHAAKSRGCLRKPTSRFVSDIAARQAGSEASGPSCAQTLSGITISDSNSSNRRAASAFLAS